MKIRGTIKWSKFGYHFGIHCVGDGVKFFCTRQMATR